jgi:hypothetical protein
VLHDDQVLQLVLHSPINNVKIFLHCQSIVIARSIRSLRTFDFNRNDF